MRLLLAAVLVVLGTQAAPLDFYQTSSWTGADAAYSVSLGPDRLLWLFGDTFTGPIVEGRRANLEMIHNSFGITSGGKTTFYPVALKPEEGYYWPSDGVVWNDRLVLFEKRIRDVAGGPDGLSFDWSGDDILNIENWRDAPPDWRVASRSPVPFHAGIACLVHDGYLYAYGLQDGAVVLMRFGSSFEYWDGEGWAQTAPRPLFQGGASEMSVFPYRDGFLAVYTEGGLGPRVVARTAPAPEGPWSDPVELYRVPDGDGLLVYAGKAHETLSTPDRLVISYCRNLGALEAHRDRPDVYFPRFVEVKLR